MSRYDNPHVQPPSRVLAFRRPLILLASCLLTLVSYLAAFSLRADFSVPDTWRYGILRSLPFLLVARIFTFRHYGLFQGWWSAAGMHEFLDIVKAVGVGSALFVTSVVFAYGVYAVPRSVVLIDTVLLIGLLSGSRLLSRAWGRRQGRPQRRRALLIGRLPSVEPLLREIQDSSDIAIQPVGLIELEGKRPGYRIHGVPILGGEDQITQAVANLGVELVLLALSPREGTTIRRILSKCGRMPLGFKIVPTLHQVLNERLQLSDLRDVEVDDLLGRHEVHLDVAGLRESLNGRRILITGGAGSIGSELARQVAQYSPAEILLVDRNEPGLSVLRVELREAHPGIPIVPLLCDIRNPKRINQILETHRPQLIYHAAAYKHVPMMEMNPVEAVKNNVFGTRDLLKAADRFGAEKFILISTDKAINPVNIMGYTKRVAERLLESATPSGCQRIAVRFGNVFGSEGSVVPILIRQIREGGPVTITDPDATRYFMTIPEAVQLVLQASALGRGGEIFVLEMGEPVRILDLATSLIRLSGLQPGEDIEIRITGLRPGERLHEETLIDSASRPTGYDKIWVRPGTGNLRPFNGEISRIEEFVRTDDNDAVLRWLRRVTEETDTDHPN